MKKYLFFITILLGISTISKADVDIHFDMFGAYQRPYYQVPSPPIIVNPYQQWTPQPHVYVQPYYGYDIRPHRSRRRYHDWDDHHYHKHHHHNH